MTSTRILKPTHDRAYFYLVYGTRHPKGLIEFRGVEKKAVEEQERVRSAAKLENRVARTGQAEFFAATHLADGGPSSLDDERENQRRNARERLRALVQSASAVKYDEVLPPLLEMPLVWESDVKEMILKLRDAGELDVKGLGPHERTAKRDHGHVLVCRPAGREPR